MLDYNSRLVHLNMNMLPLTLWLELQDTIHFLYLVKNPPDNICLSDHIQFVTSTTHSSSANKIRSSSKSPPRLPDTSTSTTFIGFGICYHKKTSISLKTLRSDFYGLYWNYFLAHYDPYLPCTWCPCSASLPGQLTSVQYL